MAAGVRRAYDVGGRRHVVGVGDWQGVSVRTEGYGGHGALSAFYFSDQARAGDFAVRDTQSVQLPGDVALSIVFLKA